MHPFKKTMNIKPHTFYQTIDGVKIYVYNFSTSRFKKTFYGSILIPGPGGKGKWFPRNWDEKGRCHGFTNGACDIYSEWPMDEMEWVIKSVADELKKPSGLPSIDQMQEQIRKWEWQMLTEFSPSSFSPNLKSNTMNYKATEGFKKLYKELMDEICEQRRQKLNQPTMNIEVGKFYKTRSGCKVRVYATDGANKGEIHGAMYEEGMWKSRYWSNDGAYYQSIRHQYDIVSEWQEPLDFDWNCLPVWADGIVKQGTGWNFYFGGTPIFIDNVWSLSNFGTILNPYAPKNYNGTLENSLHKRPTTSCC